MNITPLFDKVLLKKVKQENKSSIILPKELEDKPDLAQVVAVGDGGLVDGEHVKMIVSVGDKVLFNRYASSEFTLSGENYILIKQTDILAIIKD